MSDINIECVKIDKKSAVGGPLFEILTNESGTLLYIEVEPGQTKKPHYHKEITEYFFVISGHGKCFVDGKSYALSEGVRIKIPPGLPHTLTNESNDNLRVIAYKNRPFSIDNPDKYISCPKCDTNIIEKSNGVWVCAKCNIPYSGDKTKEGT